jgi:hypothetical protein
MRKIFRRGNRSRDDRSGVILVNEVATTRLTAREMAAGFAVIVLVGAAAVLTSFYCLAYGKLSRYGMTILVLDMFVNMLVVSVMCFTIVKRKKDSRSQHVK